MSYERTYENTRETIQLSELTEASLPVETRTTWEILGDLTLSTVMGHTIGLGLGHEEALSWAADTTEAFYDTSQRDRQNRHEKVVAKQW